MSKILPARLREAREYMGFHVADAASALGCAETDITRAEGGGVTISGEMLRRMARLYQRPVAWFSDEWDWQPDPDLLRKTEHLDPGDREAILDFAEWLAGRPPESSREVRRG